MEQLLTHVPAVIITFKIGQQRLEQLLTHVPAAIFTLKIGPCARCYLYIESRSTETVEQLLTHAPAVIFTLQIGKLLEFYGDYLSSSKVIKRSHS